MCVPCDSSFWHSAAEKALRKHLSTLFSESVTAKHGGRGSLASSAGVLLDASWAEEVCVCVCCKSGCLGRHLMGRIVCVCVCVCV